MSRREKTPFRMEPFRVDDELHRSIRVENREDAASTVPLEEALLLDSAEQRRKLILSVLTDDPVQYYDLLEQARLNDDSEVVHYAATAMAQISKQADAALQRHAARFAADPKDPAVLAEYAAALEASPCAGAGAGPGGTAAAPAARTSAEDAAGRPAEGRTVRAGVPLGQGAVGTGRVRRRRADLGGADRPLAGAGDPVAAAAAQRRRPEATGPSWPAGWPRWSARRST